VYAALGQNRAAFLAIRPPVHANGRAAAGGMPFF
jgi:acetoin utilization deacetylase AcuC-like enzyme